MRILYVVLFFVGSLFLGTSYCRAETGTYDMQLQFYNASVQHNINLGSHSYCRMYFVLANNGNDWYVNAQYRDTDPGSLPWSNPAQSGWTSNFTFGQDSQAGGSSLSVGASLGTFTDYDMAYTTGVDGSILWIFGQVGEYNVANFYGAPGRNYFSKLYIPIAAPYCNAVSYSCLMLKASDFTVHEVGYGDCYASETQEWPPTPTPTPSPSPTPSPPPPTPTPTPSPSQTPPETFPMPSFFTSPTSLAVDGNFTFDSETGVGTITVVIEQNDEYVDIPEKVYEMGTSTIDKVIPLDSDDAGDAVEHYLGRSGDALDAVSESWYRPLVDFIYDSLMTHPFMDYFNGINFEMTDELCELTVTIYDHDFVIGFCDLEDELLILRYVIIGIAGVYSVFIVLKGD